MTFHQIMAALGAKEEQSNRAAWRAEMLRRTRNLPDSEDKFIRGNRMTAADQRALAKFMAAVAKREAE